MVGIHSVWKKLKLQMIDGSPVGVCVVIGVIVDSMGTSINPSHRSPVNGVGQLEGKIRKL